MKKVFLILITFLIYSNISFADNLSSGSTMYAAESGYNKTASAVYYNPSFTTFLEGSSVSFGYMRFYNPSYFYNFYFSYMSRLNKNGTAGILWSRFNSYGDINYFDYSEDNFIVSYSHVVVKYFRPGGALKIKNISTDAGSGMGYSFTLSLLVVPVENYFISFIFTDIISSDLRWTTNLTESFERKFIIANSYKINLNPLSVVLSADYLVNNISLKDYIISGNYSYPFIKAGIMVTYSVLKAGVGVIKDDGYRISSGFSIGVMDGGSVGVNYISNNAELGFTSGIYFDYKY